MLSRLWGSSIDEALWTATVGVAGAAAADVGAAGAGATGSISKSSSESGVSGSSTTGGVTKDGAAAGDAVAEGASPCDSAAGDSVAPDDAATRATRAAIAPVLLVSVVDVEADCDWAVPALDADCEVDPRPDVDDGLDDAAPDSRTEVAGDELPASDAEVEECPDVDALFALDAGDVEALDDELPGIVGRGGGFAAGGGAAAGAGRAGGIVGIANFERGLPVVVGRALVLALAAVVEADGLLVAEPGACAPAEPDVDVWVAAGAEEGVDADADGTVNGDADAPAEADADVAAEVDTDECVEADADDVAADNVDCVPVGVVVEAGLVAAASRVFNAEAVAVLACRAFKAAEAARAADCAEPVEAMEDLLAALG